MPMDSKRLSERLKQPGSDQSFRTSETNFVKAAKLILEPAFEIKPNPTDLAKVFTSEAANSLGINPEASITSNKTGRKFFVEVKKQGPSGNAEERAAKHHTTQFYKTLTAKYGYNYHPYVTIFCESLATLPRYTTKFPYMYEPDHYFLWVDYDISLLRNFLVARCAAWLEDE